jgi:hypothetical protein
MKTFHLTAIIPGQEARIDWPSDSRNWTADKCGYGMNIGGRKMQESGGGFRVPAA